MMTTHPAHEVEQSQSERVARFFGTVHYLAIQSIIVALWITFNVVAMARWRWDPYPFILLNLVFSTQASYAAPLILMASNKQKERDDAAAGIDHAHNTENLHLTRAIHRHVIGDSDDSASAPAAADAAHHGDDPGARPAGE